MEDRELGLVPGELGATGTEEELVSEQIVPGGLRDDPHREPVLGIGSGKAVEHVQLPVGQIVRDLAVHAVEGLYRHGLVDLAPPDLVMDLVVVDEEFGVRGAAGAGSRDRCERARPDKQPFLAPDGMLDEGCGRQIAVYVLPWLEAVLLQADQLGGQRLSLCLLPMKRGPSRYKAGRCPGHRAAPVWGAGLAEEPLPRFPGGLTEHGIRSSQ